MEQNFKKILKKYWNYDTFRNGQEEIIKSIVDGNDTLVVMPTGGGKSLCYQLPALIMKGTAIVVSPLIALMKDQVDRLISLRIPATLINSSIPYDEINLRMNDALNGRYKLLYIAPERLESDRFIEQIKRLDISFIAVDEAHCISEWGHDFRPSYLNISEKLRKAGDFTFIALTATATPEVRKDIIKQLNYSNYKSFVRGFDRPNLSYITENTSEKIERILEILNETPEGSSIIYAGSRKRAEKFTTELRQNKINAEVYHGGMQPLLRKKIQERFIDDETKVIVATNAFGMGIDKADVRNVIHTDLTSTLEAYYQEAGRAGRDGLPAKCFLLYQHSDINLQDFFLRTTHPAKDDIEDVYDYLINQKDNPLPLDIPEIGIETGISKKGIINIIKILEKYDILRINKASGQGRIKFTSSMERIREYYTHTSDERRNILEALLKNVSRKAFNIEVEIDMKGIQRVTAIKDETFYNEVKSLIYDSLIKYIPASASNTVSILYRGEIGKSKIDFDALEYRRKFANQKLEKVIQYAETYECKRNFILNYFEEDDVNGKCGKCSSCKENKRLPEIDERNKFLMLNILTAAYRLDSKFSKSAIFDLLKGKMTKQIFAFKLNKTELFGSCSKINDKMLKNEIDTAVRYRFLKIATSKFRPVSITESGIEYLKNEASLDIISSQDEKKAEKRNNKLYQILSEVRNKLANKRNIQPRGIISDNMLKKISDSKPLTRYEMAMISGITQLFIDEYSADFLYETNLHAIDTSVGILEKEILKKILKRDSLKKISKETHLSVSDLSIEIQKLFDSGANPDTEHLYNDEAMHIVQKALSLNKNIPLRKLRTDYELEEDYPVLRIMLAKGKRMKNL
jgi:ATP-dependent DNA helicase RecQ